VAVLGFEQFPLPFFLPHEQICCEKKKFLSKFISSLRACCDVDVSTSNKSRQNKKNIFRVANWGRL
jgi:hypothetical protein